MNTVEGVAECWVLACTGNYDVLFHSLIDEFRRHYPWQSKCVKLFGRYTPYRTYVPLLMMGTGENYTRHTRRHFVEIARELLGHELADVSVTSKVSMESWAGYKFVVSLNGKAVSNSIQQLLTLSSCLFVESNGYESWFSAALKPYEHYIPFWREEGHTEDIVEAFKWARRNDERARTVA